jgi:hypothetical protein
MFKALTRQPCLTTNALQQFRKPRNFSALYKNICSAAVMRTYDQIQTSEYARKSSKISNSNALKQDWQQHDSPAGCVIAQQYSSTPFVSSRFHSRKKKIRLQFSELDCFIFIIF